MIMRTKIKRISSKGFTLIELLVVIFIIGILVALLLSNILGARQRAEDVQRKSDLQQFKKALTLYYSGNQAYPVLPAIGSQFAQGTTIYMKQVPEYDVDNSAVSADGEQFRIAIGLDNESDQDIAKSQARCPKFSGTWLSNYYVVCED